MPCYSPTQNLLHTSEVTPCSSSSSYPSSHSSCCNASRSDICLSSGLCLSPSASSPGGGLFSVVGCTDKSWQDGSCYRGGGCLAYLNGSSAGSDDPSPHTTLLPCPPIGTVLSQLHLTTSSATNNPNHAFIGAIAGLSVALSLSILALVHAWWNVWAMREKVYGWSDVESARTYQRDSSRRMDAPVGRGVGSQERIIESTRGGGGDGSTVTAEDRTGEEDGAEGGSGHDDSQAIENTTDVTETGMRSDERGGSR